jgi:hypothetical protein
MTKMKSPKIKRLKFLLTLPVLAFLFFAFSVPRYEYRNTGNPEVRQVPGKTLTIKGIVTRNDNNKPLPETSVVLKGKTIGTVSGQDGSFTLTDPEPKTDEKTGTLYSEVVFSFVGYKTIEINAHAEKGMLTTTIHCSLKEDVIGAGHKYEKGKSSPAPPSKSLNENVAVPTEKKSTSNKKGEDVFFIMEQMPGYPGGPNAFDQYINDMQEKMLNEKKITGKARIGFTIDENGKACCVKILNAANEQVGKCAASIIENMQKWEPGRQNGKAVPVKYDIFIEF